MGIVGMRSLLGAVALAAAGALALTGCGGASPPPSPSASSSSAAPSGGPTPAATGSAHRADPGAPSGQCPAASLAVSLGTDQGGGAAGSFYYDLAFTNTGSASCVLRGFPGLSIVGEGNGTQLGVAAARTNTPVANVILSPGGVAKARFRLVDVGALPTCQIVSGDGFRVYPPHLTQAFFVKAAGVQACSNADQIFLYVDTVAAG